MKKLLSKIVDFVFKIIVKRKIRNWQKRQDKEIRYTVHSSRPNGRLYSAQKITHIINSNPKVTWVKDSINDHWQTFDEFTRNNYHGDCEDISIYYYILLLLAGTINSHTIAIRIVRDYRGLGRYHAIVVVYANTQTFVIDNGVFLLQSSKHKDKLVEFDLRSIW